MAATPPLQNSVVRPAAADRIRGYPAAVGPVRVGIVGGSGYTGAELLRLCVGHSELEVAWATGESAAGHYVGQVHPHLHSSYPQMTFQRYERAADEAARGEVDLVFLCLPHGVSQDLVPGLAAGGVAIVDLAADFRLCDPEVYARWYGHEHRAPHLLGQFVYGLPELNRKDLSGARQVAAAGCYPTAAALATAPLVAAGLAGSEGLVVDAASGVSGAGRPPRSTTTFGAVEENFAAYGLLDHRHTPEMEQAVGAPVLFTPHLAPMTRGILATCYLRPTRPTSADEVFGLLQAAYSEEHFVSVIASPPATKATRGSNSVQVSATYDPRTGWIVAMAALDNLVKGASGQAIQCANLMLGLDESAGLTRAGLYP
ncbi:MAG: N-acetyl-gamma-glutamyl-phosphate reductase [Acidimicrobiales bacterium]